MKLYKISQEYNNGYDTYDSAIVAALSEGDAVNIYPSGEKWEGTWAESHHVTAVYVGEAADGILEGEVLCASFNAG